MPGSPARWHISTSSLSTFPDHLRQCEFQPFADFATFLLFTNSLGVNYLISNTLGFAVGLLINYLASIYWVFLYRKYTKKTPEFALFTMIGIGGIILGNSSMWYLVEFVNLSPVSAKYLVTALVLLFNYSVRKYFLFRAPVVVNE